MNGQCRPKVTPCRPTMIKCRPSMKKCRPLMPESRFLQIFCSSLLQLSLLRYFRPKPLVLLYIEALYLIFKGQNILEEFWEPLSLHFSLSRTFVHKSLQVQIHFSFAHTSLIKLDNHRAEIPWNLFWAAKGWFWLKKRGCSCAVLCCASKVTSYPF